ncbi:type II toxin-antitoxin system HipA family toxin [Synechococcus sp. BA-132 BA5]|uniref:type II toxin-antitoxin system HipA family toxin n=1 Tax=Synechococcus sp. BA-132 BA5 TaxID=3110252 RepID=UPI002B1F092D|nr:type II toxin-antitoxin system HipA family toxin [Synechococcus sp. BA-132 BA5]MEA5414761.1 type II toxin-antitoxin system HipA family toxin [Synechococcus sp. BA-132 BA5]
MTAEQECFVYVVPPGATEFVTAGRFKLKQDRQGRPVGAFVYGRRYRERPDAVELDPVELRLGARPFETGRMGGFFGALRDALPDFWGRQVIARHSGMGDPSDFDLLSLGPDDRAGALGFGRNVDPPAPERHFNRILDLERIQRAADAILADQPRLSGSAHDQVEELLQGAETSMGGARPKTTVEHEDALWLAKFPAPKDTWNQPRVEHGVLHLARRCGLQVAVSQLTQVGEADVLLVKRFDRDWSGDGYQRHRMVSALTLLQAEDSATDRQKWSYRLLADELRRASDRPTEDLRELFSRICFNAAVSNLDDHPRNHALLARSSSWRLSPAYDLTPGTMRTETRRDLAMVCGLEGGKPSRWANRGTIADGAPWFLLEREEAEAIATRVFTTVSAEWEHTLCSVGVSQRDCDAVRGAFLYAGLNLDAHTATASSG